jgi:hypothetical protein
MVSVMVNIGASVAGGPNVIADRIPDNRECMADRWNKPTSIDLFGIYPGAR